MQAIFVSYQRKKVIGGPGRKRKQSTSSTEDPENKQAKTDDDEVEEDAGTGHFFTYLNLVFSWQ